MPDSIKLKELFEAQGIKPVHDAQTKWLRIHRPSVALLLCICSGPWRYPRRKAVQELAIRRIGTRDLSELQYEDIHAIAQVDWQFHFLNAFVTEFKLGVCDGEFDDIFSLQSIKEDPQAVLRSFLMIFGKHSPRVSDKMELDFDTLAVDALIHKLPKVLGMFVRDFMFLDIMPVDRHVRKWLKENKLPTQHEKIMKMFQAEKLHARYYARALFLDKAGNPMHEPTKD